MRSIDKVLQGHSQSRSVVETMRANSERDKKLAELVEVEIAQKGLSWAAEEIVRLRHYVCGRGAK
jgi:hypothetical protein